MISHLKHLDLNQDINTDVDIMQLQELDDDLVSVDHSSVVSMATESKQQ